MSNANQRVRANKQSNTTTDTLVSPVTPEELSNYLGLDYNASDDDLLNSFLLTACGWYIAHMSNELLSRDYTLKFDRSPSDGESFSGLSPIRANLSAWINIPLYPVSVIANVDIDGDTETFTDDLDSKPPRVFLNNYGKDVVITYTAGYATVADIPKSVTLGINMMAGYLFEHRGACNIHDAAKDSGAISVWGYTGMILSL
jgi:uncharacterized phiE125 gp8 family phage protein